MFIVCFLYILTSVTWILLFYKSSSYLFNTMSVICLTCSLHIITLICLILMYIDVVIYGICNKTELPYVWYITINIFQVIVRFDWISYPSVLSIMEIFYHRHLLSWILSQRFHDPYKTKIISTTCVPTQMKHFWVIRLVHTSYLKMSIYKFKSLIKWIYFLRDIWDSFYWYFFRFRLVYDYSHDYICVSFFRIFIIPYLSFLFPYVMKVTYCYSVSRLKIVLVTFGILLSYRNNFTKFCLVFLGFMSGS